MTPKSNIELPYMDPALPFDERVTDLVDRMTLEEKVSQMVHDAQAIERLGIARHNWWNECLHGVARYGIATVFPQAIGMAATWNTELIHEAATAISDEARAKHHEAVRSGRFDMYAGLTFWTPNINIFRDPRWGRGQETYGEDPFLTSRMGVEFVKGMQGDDPRYLKIVATPKHFAVHSGPEHERHHFDARIDARNLWDTYLPAFEACIKEARAASVMGAYNRTNGEPCCASHTLLEEILRQKWGFEGYVVSDCGAIADIYRHHNVVETAAEAAAMAVREGCELNCGEVYPALLDAVEQGLIDERTIDQAVKRLFMARFRLGMFDPPEIVPYASIPFEVNDSPQHRALSYRVAQESIVLLRNAQGFLPLARTLKRIAVVGPNAADPDVLVGNYFGVPSVSVTPLDGICAAVSAETEVLYARGCGIVNADESSEYAVELAKSADVVVFVGGISQLLEGEEGQTEGLPEGMSSEGDRTDIALPEVQEHLLKALHATGTPVVLVLLNGSAVAVNWADEHLPAIVEAWYPGEEGGTALADVLFGDYNPAGRLPVTFYKSVDDLPPFTDYRMEGRTYRYFKGEPLYPFGHGLSYTSFAYSNLQIGSSSLAEGETVEVSVDVQNTGALAGDEVVQLYISDQAASVTVPLRSLQGFRRIHLKPDEQQTVSFNLSCDQFALVDEFGVRRLEAGWFTISLGGRQPSESDAQCDSAEIVFGEIAITD
jgi:beta-glucosidase